MPETRYLGIDACSAGWLVTSRWDDGLHYEIVSAIAPVLMANPDATILIDMPIGLMPSGRQLESLVRPMLGKRRSSLFAIPCRVAVFADSYAAACDIQQSRTGKKFSIQTWHICPRIRELDACVMQHERVYESHPELAFARLGQGPCEHGKKTAEGAAERTRILEQVLGPMDEVMAAFDARKPKKGAVVDDLLDAFVLLATAETGYTVLDCKEVDAVGRPVRMAVPASGDAR